MPNSYFFDALKKGERYDDLPFSYNEILYKLRLNPHRRHPVNVKAKYPDLNEKIRNMNPRRKHANPLIDTITFSFLNFCFEKMLNEDINLFFPSLGTIGLYTTDLKKEFNQTRKDKIINKIHCREVEMQFIPGTMVRTQSFTIFRSNEAHRRIYNKFKDSYDLPTGSKI